MPGLTTVTNQLAILSNLSLCQLDAEAFAASVTVGGLTNVASNAGDCN